MTNMGNAKWQSFLEKAQDTLQPVLKVLRVIGNVVRVIASYVVRLRKIIMAAPVLVAAVYLAQYNYEHLPSQVGIDIQATGQYAQMISRNAAVLAPLVVTGACLVLMFCSRRTVYPWVISIFSLALPVLILITNIFPA